MEMRLVHFSIAWEKIQREAGSVAMRWVSGRDLRAQKMAEEDLLKKNPKEEGEAFRESLLGRFARIDLDFRAPVVLRDVLDFPDEEAMRILKLRWGVYRHRLHRGRLELCEGLRGKPYAFKPAEVRH
jgi:DNA-directed RNA polymerase specialized sigma24 family protein